MNDECQEALCQSRHRNVALYVYTRGLAPTNILYHINVSFIKCADEYPQSYFIFCASIPSLLLCPCSLIPTFPLIPTIPSPAGYIYILLAAAIFYSTFSPILSYIFPLCHFCCKWSPIDSKDSKSSFSEQDFLFDGFASM